MADNKENTLQQIKYDTIYRRLFAKILDYILIAIIIKIITLFLPETTYNFNFENPDIIDPLIKNSNPFLDIWTDYSDLIVSFIIFSYFVIFNFFSGQTVGKMIVNVKIRDIDEIKKLNFLQAVLRNLSDIFFALITFFIEVEYLPIILISIWTVANLIQVFSSKKYLTIDDLIAKTVVLRVSNSETEIDFVEN